MTLETYDFWGVGEKIRKTRLPLTCFYSFSKRSFKEFAITDTEEKLMAAAAIIGDKRIPKAGYKTPAANGIPTVL